MKRVLLMLAATAAFACTTAYAQAGGGAGAGGGQAGAGNTSGGSASTGGTGSMSDHNANGQSRVGRELNGDKDNGKTSIKGCLSAAPGTDGMYTLSSKKGSEIEVGPTEKVQAEAGKKVKLSGNWTTAAGAGESASAGSNGGAIGSNSSNESAERHFQVTKVKELSGTCSASGESNDTGKKHHGHKSNSSDSTGTGSTNTPPHSR